MALAALTICISFEARAQRDLEQLQDDRGESTTLRARPQGLAQRLWVDLQQNVSVGHFAFTSAPMDQVIDAAARVESYNFFMIDYRLSRSRRISLRPSFFLGTSGTNFRDEYQTTDFRVADFNVAFIDSQLGKLPFNTILRGQLRVYAPTSEDSQSRGMLTRIRPLARFQTDLMRKLQLIVNIEPDYFVQGRTAFVNDRGRTLGNRHFGYEFETELRYSLTRIFGLGVMTGHTQSWAHTSESNGLNERFRNEEVSLQTSVTVNWRSVFLITGVSQRRNVARPRDDFQLFNPQETDFFLLSMLRF